MQGVLSAIETRNDDIIKNAELEADKAIQIGHLNFQGDNDRVQAIQKGINDRVQSITEKLYSDPTNARQHMAELKSLQRDVTANKTSGEWYNMEQRKAAYDTWEKDNAKTKIDNPDRYNDLKAVFLKNMEEETGKDSKAIFKGEQIIGDLNLSDPKFQNILNQIQPNGRTLFSPNGRFRSDITEIEKDTVKRAAINLLQSDPNFKGYIRQSQMVGQTGYGEPIENEDGSLNMNNPFAQQVSAAMDIYSHKTDKKDWDDMYKTKQAQGFAASESEKGRAFQREMMKTEEAEPGTVLQLNGRVAQLSDNILDGIVDKTLHPNDSNARGRIAANIDIVNKNLEPGTFKNLMQTSKGRNSLSQLLKIPIPDLLEISKYEEKMNYNLRTPTVPGYTNNNISPELKKQQQKLMKDHKNFWSEFRIDDTSLIAEIVSEDGHKVEMNGVSLGNLATGKNSTGVKILGVPQKTVSKRVPAGHKDGGFANNAGGQITVDKIKGDVESGKRIATLEEAKELGLGYVMEDVSEFDSSQKLLNLKDTQIFESTEMEYKGNYTPKEVKYRTIKIPVQLPKGGIGTAIIKKRIN